MLTECWFITEGFCEAFVHVWGRRSLVNISSSPMHSNFSHQTLYNRPVGLYMISYNFESGSNSDKASHKWLDTLQRNNKTNIRNNATSP